MKQSSRFFLLALIMVLPTGGCGPLQSPMPVRFEADQQAAIDDAWNDAFEPVDRLDNQHLLDALMTSRAYEAGVDRLMLRSEKQCAAGLVVMEVLYDRAVPGSDSFIVTLKNTRGRVLRREHYSREQVETTYRELFVEAPQLAQRRDGSLPPGQEQRRSELQERLATCESLFPTFEHEQPAGPQSTVGD